MRLVAFTEGGDEAGGQDAVEDLIPGQPLLEREGAHFQRREEIALVERGTPDVGSTGRGVAYLVARAFERIERPTVGAEAIVQGFGNVGSIAAFALAEKTGAGPGGDRG